MNQPANTASVFQGATYIERHEEKPVEIGILFDATGSREESIDQIRRDFTAQINRLIDQDAAGKIRITLFSHSGNGVKNVGTFDDLEEVSNAVSHIQCVKGPTEIETSLLTISRLENGQHIPKLDALIIHGDGVDEVDMSYNTNRGQWGTINRQRQQSVIAASEDFGRPIITLLETTHGIGHTVPNRDVPTMSAMSESTGIQGCPIQYDSRINFADYVLVVAAATKGPKAVEELKQSGAIPDDVWNVVPDEMIESVTAVTEEIAEENTQENVKEEPKRRRFGTGFLGEMATHVMTTAVVAGALFVFLPDEYKTPIKDWVTGGNPEPETSAPEIKAQPETLYAEPIGPKQPIAPEISRDELETSFQQNSTFTFGDDKFRAAFASGEVAMTTSFARNLDELAGFINENPGACPGGINIIGHTDSRGSNASNMQLSIDRAESVKAYLQGVITVSVPISVEGRGETERLVRDGFDGPEGDAAKAQNRRIAVDCNPG